MIKLTLYNGADIILNADMIELVERTPDTLVSLSNGKKILVKESVDEVVNRTITYKRLVGRKHTVLSGRVERAMRRSVRNKDRWT